MPPPAALKKLICGQTPKCSMTFLASMRGVEN
jgi:hypothetical protein